MQAGGQFNTRLEALRGVAALTVAAFHAGQTTTATPEGYAQLAFGPEAAGGLPHWTAAAYSLLLNAHGAVIVFFVLSGHVLRLSLDRMGGQGGGIATPFLVRRAFRLWPPIAACLAAFAILYFATGRHMPTATDADYSLSGLLRHLALVDLNINGVLWTLQVEAWGAVLIMLLWFAGQRWGSAILWISAFALGGLSFASGPEAWIARIFQFSYAFVAGMLVADWCRIMQRTGLVHLGAWYLALGALLVAFAPAIVGHASNYRTIIEVLGAVALVAGLAVGLGGWIGRFLDLAVARFYGRISYSFYLLHPLTLTVLWIDRPWIVDLVSLGLPPFVVAALAFVATTLVITPLAALSYHFVEKPAIALGKRFGRVSAVGRPAVAQRKG